MPEQPQRRCKSIPEFPPISSIQCRGKTKGVNGKVTACASKKQARIRIYTLTGKD